MMPFSGSILEFTKKTFISEGFRAILNYFYSSAKNFNLKSVTDS